MIVSNGKQSLSKNINRHYIFWKDTLCQDLVMLFRRQWVVLYLSR